MSAPEFSGPSWQDEPEQPGGGSANRRDAGGYGRPGGLGSRDDYSNGSASGQSQPRRGRPGRSSHRFGSNGVSGRGNDGYGADHYGDAAYRGGPAYKVSDGGGRDVTDFRGSRQYGSGNGFAGGGLMPLPGGGGGRGGRGGGGRGGGGGWGPDGPEGPTSLYPYGQPGRGLVEPGQRPPRLPSGPRRRQPGDWWRHWTLKKAGLLMSAMAFTVVLILFAGFFYAYSKAQIPPNLLTGNLQQSSQVYFSNGQEVGCFCSVNRTNLTPNQVQQAKWVVDAVTAAEDRNFFHEGGVSITGILRAAKNDLSGGSLQGGSTITEELVKQYFQQTSGNLSYTQKIKEILISMKLAKHESKWWVMRQYLNTIYFGHGALGVEAAAETYFGKHATQLNIAQAAMLAAMIQSPSDFDPTHPNHVVPGLGSLAWRWKNEVLANMVKDGNITAQQAAAQKFPKVTIGAPAATWGGYRGYIMQLVENELTAYYHMPLSKIGSMGLQIYTSINERLMNDLRKAVRYNKGLMRQYGASLPSYVHVGAVLEKPGTGQIVAFYGGPGYNVKQCKQVNCKFPTILGGAPVGSSFKPYVLTTAISQGMSAQTSILNSHSPLCIPPADETQALRLKLSRPTSQARCPTSTGYYYFNEPSENTPGVNLNVAESTAASNNAAYEDLIHRTGVNSVIKMAAKLGVNPGTVSGLKSLFWSGGKHPGQFPGAVNAALGEGSMTPVDQANTFATLVSGGISATPHIIKYIVQNGTKIKAKSNPHRAISASVAADADWALSFDTNASMHGTGVPNAVWNRPMVAKTGTLGSGNHSAAAWFIGAIPQYSMSVALYTEHPTKQFLDGLPSVGGWTGGYGGAWPAHIWHTFMSTDLNNLPVKQLPPTNFSPPRFTKWVQAPRIQKKPKCGPGGGFGGGPGGGNGGGNGHGHGRHHFFFAAFNRPCPPSPSPSPPVSGSPPPSPSPSPSFSPSPLPSPTPSPSPSKSKGAAIPARQPARQQVVATPSLTTSAVLPRPAYVKPGWMPLRTGLV